MALEESRRPAGNRPDRATVIVAGAVGRPGNAAPLRPRRLEVSEHDLMHGAALAAAELSEEAEPGR